MANNNSQLPWSAPVVRIAWLVGLILLVLGICGGILTRSANKDSSLPAPTVVVSQQVTATL